MKRVKVLVLGVLVAMFLSACDFSVYGLPLPGGPDVGENPMTVKVEFADVLDLVPQSTVKVNDVSVGKVTAIDLEGYQALVTLQVRRDVELPDNAVAELRQTSLLGEKFVELSAPDQGASSNPLGDGDTIPIERAGRNPEVEEVLGALSLLLNGGGVAQLQTITRELNNALEGREGTARSVLEQIRTFMGQLDDNKQDIVDAIESVNDLAVSVREQQGSIDAALDELPSALESLDQQRDDLVTMLQKLSELGDVGVEVISASKQGTIDTLEQLNPVLTELGNAGDAFVKSFHVFLTYPFVDEVIGRDPQVARNLHMGDYTNLSIQLEIDLSGGVTGGPTGLPTEIPTLLPTDLDPTVILNLVTRCIRSGDVTSTPCTKLLGSVEGLTKLRKACLKKKNEKTVVCRIINQIPGPPGGGLPTELPTELPTGLPDLPGILGLGRTAVGPTAASPRGPTMGQLSRMFDPALVRLLVPGMVAR
jgi:phospholipid/cholesterol/gamma-HCH transport system substrate-binding protein